MSFGRIKLVALFLAAACAVTTMPAVGPAQAFKGEIVGIEPTSVVAKPGMTTKPGAGSVGTTGPRGGVGTTTRGRTGRSK
jgi:hypothetical protein